MYLKADARIVDAEGKQHPVHSTLLRLKIPLFRDIEFSPESSTVYMDFASPELVELLCDIAYGMDRFCVRHCTIG